MPRVKIDYVVSVSSEDPDHPANNLVAGEINKKKWLCSKGEQSCSVVLQLHHAVIISAVHIGAQQAAFVEVLVGTSVRTDDQYEVLVPRCVFLGPAESRRGGGGVAGERVRSFSSAQLAEGTRCRRWDRVRLLCSQPYNKHCQFGLSFIHIHEPEGASVETSSTETQHITSTLGAPTFRDKFLTLGSYSSDEDEFRPGELFARHRLSLKQTEDAVPGTNTDAQIRRASAQAFKNISDTNTKLQRTPIAKVNSKREQDWGRGPEDRRRQGLLEEAKDERPYARSAAKRALERHDIADKVNSPPDDADGDKRNKTRSSQDNNNVKEEDLIATRSIHNPSSSKTIAVDDKGDPISGQRRIARQADGERRRPRDGGARQIGANNAGSAKERSVLGGVVFAMSGYVNPERAALRAAGLALGARYRPDWTADCTHLICAFPNTPKLRMVVASAPHAHVVSGSWVRACSEQRRRLPEEPYALHPRAAAPPDRRNSDTDDTDDEIERVRERPPAGAPSRTRAVRSSSPSDNDVCFVRDERIKDSVTLSDESEEASTEEEVGEEQEAAAARGVLPDFLEGLKFVVAAEAAGAGFDVRLLGRYVRAYGGLVLQESELEEGAAVDYVLCAAAGRGRARGARGVRLRADWLWRCHSLRALAPTVPYELDHSAAGPTR